MLEFPDKIKPIVHKRTTFRVDLFVLCYNEFTRIKAGLEKQGAINFQFN